MSEAVRVEVDREFLLDILARMCGDLEQINGEWGIKPVQWDDPEDAGELLIELARLLGVELPYYA